MTFGWAARAAPISAGTSPAGAASRKIRPESRISPTPACSISATTSSEAMASARENPVSTMIRPATAVATKANTSVRMCRNAPSRLRLRCAPGLARFSSMVAVRFTATPASATPMTTPPVTAGGVISRRTAS